MAREAAGSSGPDAESLNDRCGIRALSSSGIARLEIDRTQARRTISFVLDNIQGVPVGRYRLLDLVDLVRRWCPNHCMEGQAKENPQLWHEILLLGHTVRRRPSHDR